MPTKEIATRPLPGVIPGEVLGLQDGPLPLTLRLVSRVGEMRRSWSRTVHDLRYRQPRRRTTRKLLVLVPAHNEADTIGHTLHALLTQTRQADRIVVIADNCTDDTATIARRYRGITVMETVGNTDKKVGALIQGWRRYQAGYDFIAGVDADTVLDPRCLEHLEYGLVDQPNAGGIMAKYTFDQRMGVSAGARMLIRMQRLEFASWTMDALRKRKTYVLGGQASLFRAEALRSVAMQSPTQAPWNAATMVEDMQLTGDLRAMRYETPVSPEARAYAGPMLNLRSLWHQRRKWDQGMVQLLTTTGINRWTSTLWRQQLSLLSNGVTRLLFAFMLTAALIVHQYVWAWFWAVPPAISVLLNVRQAMLVPNRTAADVISSALLIPVELYLMFRVACATASWATVLSGIKRDAWASQARAESGQGSSNGAAKVLGVMLLALLIGAGSVYGWLHATIWFQRVSLTTGWYILATATLIQTAGMLWRIVRRNKKNRP
jgi:cellulose synthase/poly-beta-1,6-N-acetylglucosamine synthase-like glycosyltransferase